jgi:hypothetical protein
MSHQTAGRKKKSKLTNSLNRTEGYAEIGNNFYVDLAENNYSILCVDPLGVFACVVFL